MSALRYGTTLFIDVLQWPIGVLAVANTMASHTCLAGILLALDQHLDSTRLEGDVGKNGE